MGRRVVAALGIVVVLSGGWWVTGSKIFGLRTLRVVGASHLSRAEVARLAGLSDATNVFWFSSARAERSLERDPWVASAKVSRTLPSEVTVDITERFPVAVLQMAPGVRVIVAPDGTVLGRALGAGGLPLIDGSLRRAAGRSRVDPRTPGLAVAARLPSSARSLISAISVSPDGRVTLSLRGGVPVRFGDATQVEIKGQALVAILSWAVRNGVHPAAVDVSAPGAPALTPAEAATKGSGP